MSTLNLDHYSGIAQESQIMLLQGVYLELGAGFSTWRTGHRETLISGFLSTLCGCPFGTTEQTQGRPGRCEARFSRFCSRLKMHLFEKGVRKNFGNRTRVHGCTQVFFLFICDDLPDSPDLCAIH